VPAFLFGQHFCADLVTVVAAYRTVLQIAATCSFAGSWFLYPNPKEFVMNQNNNPGQQGDNKPGQPNQQPNQQPSQKPGQGGQQGGQQK